MSVLYGVGEEELIKATKSLEEAAKKHNDEGKSEMCTSSWTAACTYCKQYWNCDGYGNLKSSQDDDELMEEETKGEKMNKQENNINANNETSITIYEGGMKVKDTMTGVEGTITAWCHYYGVETDQVRITYKSGNGAIIEDWVSVGRLAVAE